MMSPIPTWLALLVGATVFTVMLSLGLLLGREQIAAALQRRVVLAAVLFAVFIPVPATAVLIVKLFGLKGVVAAGILLMAISPGAPVALLRSVAAGGHRAFASSLQIAAVMLAVVSMPLTIAALDQLYEGAASITPWEVARQVFLAQLAPLGLGFALRHASAPVAARLQPRLKRIGTVLLFVTVLIVLIDVWETTVTAGFRVLTAIALITCAALAVGHFLGGPEPAMRTAVAITSAARNTGLALLVAALNAAPPAIDGTILAYLVVSALAIAPYSAWRRASTRTSCLGR